MDDNSKISLSLTFPQGLGGLPGTSSITGPSVSYNSGYKVTAEEEEEPEVIKQWREPESKK